MLQSLDTPEMHEIKIYGTKLPEVSIEFFEYHSDNRGTFRRVWDQRSDQITAQQISISSNSSIGTLRGIHSLHSSLNETKIIEVVKGKIFDVVVDTRPTSKNYLRWMGIFIDETNNYKLIIPSGFGHGYVTLLDNTILGYQMSCLYNPELEIGFRFDDPAIGIEWPINPSIISEKDLSWGFISNE